MFTLGVDFGTNSVRALVVRCSDGAEYGSRVVGYPSGAQGVLLDPKDGLLARQRPADYLFGLDESIKGALAEAGRKPDFDRSKVVGIGVDTTGSSPIPVDDKNQPLALSAKWKDDLNAQCWLWKDHTSWREAAKITELSGGASASVHCEVRRGLLLGMVLGQALALPECCSRDVRRRLLLG